MLLANLLFSLRPSNSTSVTAKIFRGRQVNQAEPFASSYTSASPSLRLRFMRACFLHRKCRTFITSSSQTDSPLVVWIWNSVFQFCPSGGQFLRKSAVYPCSYGRFWLLAPRLLVGLGMKNCIL